MWHCPHCGAPQAETARCWVCRRSSTTCSTCSHFRASLATDVNYCALDRRRRPLTGTELRGCWTERPALTLAAAQPAGADPSPFLSAAVPTPDAAVTARGFVPVEDIVRRGQPPAEPSPVAPPPEAELPFAAIEPIEGWEGRTSLFGEPER